MNGLADILDGIITILTRHVVFPSKASAVAVALWGPHTHAIQAADATPYIIVTRPEKRAGKTRLQEVLEHLVSNPLRTTKRHGLRHLPGYCRRESDAPIR